MKQDLKFTSINSVQLFLFGLKGFDFKSKLKWIKKVQRLKYIEEQYNQKQGSDGKGIFYLKIAITNNRLILKMTFNRLFNSSDFDKVKEQVVTMLGLKWIDTEIQDGFCYMTFNYVVKQLHETFEDYKNEEYPIIKLGLDDNQEKITSNFLLNPHLLIVSSTGGGKTTYLKLISEQLNNERTDLFLLNGKKSGINLNCYKEIHFENENILSFMRKYVSEMKERDDELHLLGFEDFLKTDLKSQVLVIDEYVTILERMDKKEMEEFQSLLGQVLSTGRSLGYWVILSVTSPKSDYIPTQFRNMFKNRLILCETDSSINKMVLGSEYTDLTSLSIGSGYIMTRNTLNVIKYPRE